jgi:transcriptional regulator with XRE-family HTH domain
LAKQKAEPQLVQTLRERIRASGESLNELGKRAGIDHSRLSRFMSKKRSLTLGAAGRLCEVLGLELVERPGRSAAKRGAPPATPSTPPADELQTVKRKRSGRTRTGAG